MGDIRDPQTGSEEGLGWYFVAKSKLGKGSYGEVYLAREESGKEVAVKLCKARKEGIPNILEASIMASMRHPNLNHTSRIVATSDHLQIIQRLALRDMAQHCRVEKNQVSSSQLRTWCHGLAQAVKCLHEDQLIHSDIKASNVLLYPDDKVKLTDFTLAVKCWQGLPPFTHPVATCSHRPLENFCQEVWSYPLDIWSLGCTFFEIAYGEGLFSGQSGGEPLSSEDTQAWRKRSAALARKRTINSILDWGAATEEAGWVPPYGAGKYPVEYNSYTKPAGWERPEMALFNSLLLAMLRVEPEKRLTIGQVLDHPYFSGLERKPCAYIKPSPGELSSRELNQMEKMISPYCTHSTVRNMTRSLFTRCKDIPGLTLQERAGGCLWIASKLVFGSPPEKIGLSPHRVLQAERDICHYLNFVLHRVDFL